MPELVGFDLYTHKLDNAQEALVRRALEHFHDAQRVIKITRRGVRDLPTDADDLVCWSKLSKAAQPKSPEITVTGLGLNDNWFSHTDRNRTVVTSSDWIDAFHGAETPVGAPDAYLLHEFSAAAILASSGLPEDVVSHEDTTGCMSDLCLVKSDMALKLRTGFLCGECRAVASAAGLSGAYLDAVQALLDRIRLLAIGRASQIVGPAPPERDRDADFIAGAQPPAGLFLPPGLLRALKARAVTVLVGSGMSLQSDVAVRYPQATWKSLPTWTEVGDRLSQRLEEYRGSRVVPRPSETLDEFLAELDSLKVRLGPAQFYPRAIFDIFLPQILDTGVSNRLVFRLPVQCVLTTNYDYVLSYAAPPGTPTYTWREAMQACEYMVRANGPPPILKLHGCASRPDTVILTRIEYESLGLSQAYRELLRRVFADKATLFIGYGLNDPRDLDMAISHADLSGAAQGEKFALVHRSLAQSARSKFANVQMIPYDSHDEVCGIIGALVRETNGAAR